MTQIKHYKDRVIIKISENFAISVPVNDGDKTREGISIDIKNQFDTWQGMYIERDISGEIAFYPTVTSYPETDREIPQMEYLLGDIEGSSAWGDIRLKGNAI